MCVCACVHVCMCREMKRGPGGRAVYGIVCAGLSTAGLVCGWNCQVLHWRTHSTCSLGHLLPVAVCGGCIHPSDLLLSERGIILKTSQ